MGLFTLPFIVFSDNVSLEQSAAEFESVVWVSDIERKLYWSDV
mgnify:CR=1 FL=1